MIDPDKK